MSWGVIQLAVGCGIHPIVPIAQGQRLDALFMSKPIPLIEQDLSLEKIFSILLKHFPLLDAGRKHRSLWLFERDYYLVLVNNQAGQLRRYREPRLTAHTHATLRDLGRSSGC